MEKYGDEGFIRLLRKKQEDARNRDIKKGPVWAGDEEIVFIEREIFKNQMWMLLPGRFGLLNKEAAKIKYPNENRPEIIYTSPDTTVNISFSHKKEKLKPGQENEVRDYMEQFMHRLYPFSSTIDKQTSESAGKQLAWFDLITPAIDSEIYNLMFFASLKDRLLTGCCNCLKADQEIWKDFFLQMLASVNIA